MHFSEIMYAFSGIPYFFVYFLYKFSDKFLSVCV
jgi:hypothetical protein